MTGIASSLLEILEGLVQLPLAVFRFALALVRTALHEAGELASETVGFVYRTLSFFLALYSIPEQDICRYRDPTRGNALVLGFIAAVAVAFQLYQQNTARVKSRVEKKL
ncbi:hypothetical protein JCM11641_002207 [Rhodosporidiobolus odoratus]